MSGLEEGLDDLLKGANPKRDVEPITSEPIGCEVISEKDKAISPISLEDKANEDKTMQLIGSEDIAIEDIAEEDDKLDLLNLTSAQNIQLKDLKIAVKKAQGKNPVFSVWSPFCTAMMIYLHRTTPRFSKSMLGRVVIEKALEDMYPELSKQIREEMKKDH
ncbi:MAG: hypothetical protein ACE14P_09930 [Methanotrichaceae archaeon]